jgi:hypothetical protein
VRAVLHRHQSQEQGLQESDSRLQRMAEGDVQYRLNQHFHLGVPEEEAIGHLCHSFLHASDVLSGLGQNQWWQKLASTRLHDYGGY